MKSLLYFSLLCSLLLASFTKGQHLPTLRSTKNLKAKFIRPAVSYTITGIITGKTIEEDSLFFVTGEIKQKYYDVPISPVRVVANKFTVAATVNYPQMRRIFLKSDKGLLVYRHGEYFIDESTNAITASITADYRDQECQQVNGPTALEYHNKFIPFFYSNREAYDCQKQSFDEDILWDKATRIDSTLYRYVQANPASYVALWSLIERFSKFGHSQVREKTLAGFSKSIKNSYLWQTLKEDMRKAMIKQGAPFPVFLVKGITQSEHLLQLPKAQYTLVDFWFCRCRPCIESFPALKKVYATYKEKGFEVISISTDRTQEVPLWQKRVKEYELPWTQYLDENAAVSTNLAVYAFPTTFLLDHRGKVLLRDISPTDLEKFLAANLQK